MTAIRWLHLTDLHVGATIPTTWPSLRAKLEEDLERTLRHLGGPLDLVLFTGDLVQRGTAEEYKQLDDVLDHLWRVLANLGSAPVLFAVPGNHDLVRPEDHIAEVRNLLRWKDDPELADIFLHPTKGKNYRDILNAAFAPYTEWMHRWHTRHPLPSWIELRSNGKVPGDFAATIDRNGIKFGILGLNSAFLHLAKRIGPGDLALDPRQFHALCDTDPKAWAERHDLNVLMSHHPPNWFSDSGIIDYKNHIYQPQWFAAHLCGHLHVARAEVRSLGGSPAERLFQGTALLGELEFEDRDGKRNERIVGYGAVRVERKGNDFELRLWPRLMVRGADGRDKFVPDPAYSLPDDISTHWPLPGRSQAIPPPSPTTPVTPSRAPEPPGKGYNPTWYVAPPRDHENAILSNLDNPNVPIRLVAPPLFGKSTYLQRIIHQLRDQDAKRNQGGIVLIIDFGALSDQAPEDIHACLREMADVLIEQYASEMRRTNQIQIDCGDWVSQAWTRDLPPERKLRQLLQKNILNQQHERVVLVLDKFDRLANKSASDPIARMLRSLSEEYQQGVEVWGKLRVILATTGSHALLSNKVDAVSELFSVTLNVALEPFGSTQLEELRARYDVDWTEEQLEQLRILTGGWPFLVRQILYLAATGIATNELLDPQRLMTEHCSLQLQRLWLHVCEYERLRRVVCALLHGSALTDEEWQMLRATGLARRKTESNGYEMSSELVAGYFKIRCGAGSRGTP